MPQSPLRGATSGARGRTKKVREPGVNEKADARTRRLDLAARAAWLYYIKRRTQDEIAAEISTALGIPVHYEPIEIAEFSAGLTAKGFPAHLVQHLSNVVQDYQDGIFAGTNDYIETIGGKTPYTVADYVDAHREAFATDGPYAIPVPVVTP